MKKVKYFNFKNNEKGNIQNVLSSYEKNGIFVCRKIISHSQSSNENEIDIIVTYDSRLTLFAKICIIL